MCPNADQRSCCVASQHVPKLLKGLGSRVWLWQRCRRGGKAAFLCDDALQIEVLRMPCTRTRSRNQARTADPGEIAIDCCITHYSLKICVKPQKNASIIWNAMEEAEKGPPLSTSESHHPLQDAFCASLSSSLPYPAS